MSNLSISRRSNLSENVFQRTLMLSALLLIVILLGIFITLVINSMPSIKAVGFSFIYGRTWDPVSDEYGALPFLVGTLLTAFLALLISTPFSLAIGLFLGEYYPKGPVAGVIKNVFELLAGIPSVIYGFWGIFVLVPIMRSIEMKLGVPPVGVGILTASIILSIMIMPYSASLIRQVVTMVPSHLKEAAYSLGATRMEVIRYVVMPNIRSGLFAGILLSLGRALGETMAVTLLIGNTDDVPTSVFNTGNTMASVIANQFTEATGDLHYSVLIEMGLFLFVVTTIINMIGRKIINRFSNG
ncbi:MAG TPA: phosphate ABC transporter permease subunit PstC [Bacteroidia bacterium]|jgi:phosphate transport system permease protein|nr:phosphate ABC transporter permease subunit PstC [Bacteroidia bacterium]